MKKKKIRKMETHLKHCAKKGKTKEIRSFSASLLKLTKTILKAKKALDDA